MNELTVDIFEDPSILSFSRCTKYTHERTMKAAMETTVYLRGRDSFAAVAFPSAASAAAAAAVVLPAAAAPSAPPIPGKFPARTDC